MCVTVYQTGVRGAEMPVQVSYVLLQSKLTGQGSGFAYTQGTLPFCGNYSDSSGHNIGPC